MTVMCTSTIAPAEASLSVIIDLSTILYSKFKTIRALICNNFIFCVSVCLILWEGGGLLFLALQTDSHCRAAELKTVTETGNRFNRRASSFCPPAAAAED